MPGLPPGTVPGLARLAPPARDAGADCRDRSRQLQRRDLQGHGRDHPFLPEGRRLLGQYAGRRRQAGRLQGRLHLRCRAAAAVPSGIPRRPPAGPRRGLGYAEETLVRADAQRAYRPQGRTALDPTGAERQLHVRGVPHHRLQAQFRRADGQLRQPMGIPRSRLPVLPRPRFQAPGMGSPARPRHRQGLRHAAQGQRQGHPGGNLWALPCAPRAAGRRLRAEAPADGRLPAEQPHPRAVPDRRQDQGRGVRIRLLHPEQDVRQGREVHRLPQPAQRRTEGAGQRRLPAVPQHRRQADAPGNRRQRPAGEELRLAGTPPSPARHAWRAVHFLPHAGQVLHGQRLSSRPRLHHSQPAARAEARHARRLPELPCRQGQQQGRRSVPPVVRQPRGGQAGTVEQPGAAL
ncbi:hypothetical protein D9M71_258950 [compost metagenome]